MLYAGSHCCLSRTFLHTIFATSSTCSNATKARLDGVIIARATNSVCNPLTIDPTVVIQRVHRQSLQTLPTQCRMGRYFFSFARQMRDGVTESPLLPFDDGEFEHFDAGLLVAQHSKNSFEHGKYAIPEFAHGVFIGERHRLRWPTPRRLKASLDMIELVEPLFLSLFDLVERLCQRTQLLSHLFHLFVAKRIFFSPMGFTRDGNEELEARAEDEISRASRTVLVK